MKNKSWIANQSVLELLEDLAIIAVEMTISSTTLSINEAISDVLDAIKERLEKKFK